MIKGMFWTEYVKPNSVVFKEQITGKRLNVQSKWLKKCYNLKQQQKTIKHGTVADRFMKAAEDGQAPAWSEVLRSTVIGHLTIIPPVWFTWWGAV